MAGSATTAGSEADNAHPFPTSPFPTSPIANAPVPEPKADRLWDLPAGAQAFLAATLVTMIGNGMLFGFLFIYFTDVRHFSSPVAGALLSLTSLTMLTTSSLGGWLSDRVGAKRALLGGQLYAAVVFALFMAVRSLPTAVFVCATTGLAQGLMSPAQSAFSSVIVSDRQRPLMSAWVRIALNIGAALGITVAGFFLDTDRPVTFTVMFAANSATFLLYAAIVVRVRPLASTLSPKAADRLAEDAASSTRGYRDVLGDRFFVRLLPLDLASGLMFGLVFLVMPTTFLKRLGASERMIGLVAMSGAVAVIATQLGVAKVVRGRPRLHALAVMFVCFAAAFLFGAGSVGKSLLGAAWFVTAAQCIGGLGESFLGPTRGPLTADVAPQELLGRYFGLQMMMFQGGFGLASAIAGVSLDVSLRGTWLAGCGVALGAAAWSYRLDALVPRAARLSP